MIITRRLNNTRCRYHRVKIAFLGSHGHHGSYRNRYKRTQRLVTFKKEVLLSIKRGMGSKACSDNVV